MAELHELLKKVCKEGGITGKTVYNTNNGFDLFLGSDGSKFAYSIRCINGDEYIEQDRLEDIDDFEDALISALYRVFNSENFNEDNEFEKSWVEATEDNDQEYKYENIRAWLQYELSD